MVHALEDRPSRVELAMTDFKDRLDKVKQDFEQVGNDMEKLDMGLQDSKVA